MLLPLLLCRMTVSATPAWGQCEICTLCIHMSLATSNLSSRSQPTAYGCAFSYAQQPPSPHAQPGRHKSVDRPHCMACQICPVLHKSCQPRTGGPLLMFYISHPGKNSSYMADAKTAAASLQQPAVTSPTSNSLHHQQNIRRAADHWQTFPHPAAAALAATTAGSKPRHPCTTDKARSLQGPVCPCASSCNAASISSCTNSNSSRLNQM